MNEEIKIAFDVDGTLIHQRTKKQNGIFIPFGNDLPRYDIIILYKILQHSGCKMIIWSGSGVDYAKRWGEKLGLEPFSVYEKGEIKPDIVFDDQDVKLGKINIKLEKD